MRMQNQAEKEKSFRGPLFHALIGPGECLDGADPFKIHTLPASFCLRTYSKC